MCGGALSFLLNFERGISEILFCNEKYISNQEFLELLREEEFSFFKNPSI